MEAVKFAMLMRVVKLQELLCLLDAGRIACTHQAARCWTSELLRVQVETVRKQKTTLLEGIHDAFCTTLEGREEVRRSKSKGFLLHIALRHSKISLQVVQALIARHPQAIQTEACDGLPLHIAVEHHTSVEVVQALLMAYPEAIKEEPLPLDIAIITGGRAEVVRALLAAYPGAIAVKRKRNMLPLHLAVKYHPPLEVVQTLLTAYPEATKEKAEYNMLPLHIAVQHFASPEVVRALLAVYPQAVWHPCEIPFVQLGEKFGAPCFREFRLQHMLPIHIAATHPLPSKNMPKYLAEFPDATIASTRCASVEVVQALLAVYPKTIKKECNKGLPLHAAVQYCVPPEVLQALLAAHPEAIKKDVLGIGLPLHAAVQQGASPEIVQTLLMAYPEAAKKERDIDTVDRRSSRHMGRWVGCGQRMLPLHIAVQLCASPEVVQALLAAYPEASKKECDTNTVDNSTGAQGPCGQRMLPLHIAVTHDPIYPTYPSLEVVQALLAAYPEAIKKECSKGLPLHAAVLYRASLEVVQELLAGYPEAIKENVLHVGLPLHAAVQQGASLEIVQTLLTAYPEAAKEEPLPLQIAVQSCWKNGKWQRRASPQVVQALLAAYPEAEELISSESESEGWSD